MNKNLKQLKFRCEHRGMREMDILMGGFFNMYFKEFSLIALISTLVLLSISLYKCFLGEIIWPNNISIILQT